MTIVLTPEEANSIIESLRWTARHIEDSEYRDPGKPARVHAAKEVERSVREKIRKAEKAGA